MVKAIRVHETGGPEVLRLDEIEVGQPGPGEARVRHGAIGLNFIDCYFRSGLYRAPAGLPFVPGNEGAGTVVAVGEGVTSVAVGDRVAYVGPLGSYAEERLVPADRLVALPEGISFEIGAAAMLKGMTARYLLRRTFRVGPGTTLLFHAAAGGVGQIAGQWAKHLGATVIGTAGGAEKVALARTRGYDHVIDYRKDDFVAAVKEITGGKGVDVVYDSIGKDTFPKSLDCLKPLGMFVSFGNASGPVPPFAMQELASRGSLFATRATLFTYVAARADLEETAADLFSVVGSGAVEIPLSKVWKLEQAAEAHRALEARATTGSMVFVP
ncbi:quinone oxidoreductase family protein [Pinisolibacter aquiterrae]|uniref:quinone oxidoreductase family protein n=1 Tax=Pinisolibacter aquiterrae TaxID=2815579 RepID=UPI001C3DF060|nr:quinone oxidoreductase [Pinisolibacter aquiterrae]MBV5265931.1 quinone oxidoreductase [Pinisolibacter aquiterrae]MCC8237211.1 quinone oxidoreductase [Pinisolibacter aquiterrae]